MKCFILIFLLVCKLFSDNIVTNGKTLFLEFDSNFKGKIIYKDKNYPILRHPKESNKKLLIIPISYRQKEDIDLVHVNGKKRVKIPVHVKIGNYKKENLKVNPKKVTPPKNVKNRIYKEYEEAMKIYNTFNKTRYWSKPFLQPLKSKITSEFGNARVFNGKLKSFHSGVDFRASIGTSIKATNTGKVVLAKDRYYAGGSVVIDHGEGVYSCYYHLSKIHVQVGQLVERSQIIAKSGNSGRVTGPHLHFSFMVQGVQIDPLDFIYKINLYM